jgi:carboxypeptidase T
MKLFILIIFALLGNATLAFSQPDKILPKEENGPWIVNVYYQDKSELDKFTKRYRPWRVDIKNQYFVIDVSTLSQYQELFDYGFNVEINKELTQSTLSVRNTIKDAENRNIELDVNSIPGFACYRTVEETYSTMDTLVAVNPTLASIVDIGDSWEKENLGAGNGYDLRVLKITNSAITGTKPILYAMSSIHAREYTPAELNTRFAEFLLNNYGTDADATWLIDHREIHLLLQGNPDGRKVAEGGVLKRKTQNNNFCAGQSTRGVDMNRNFPFLWNQGTGSSGSPCNQSYRGPNTLSENETTAIDTYIRTLFADNRGPGLNDPAPADTTGVYLDIHNVAGLILWPYGYSDSAAQAPNHTELQTLGRKFGFYNGYRPEQSNSTLGGADGASDDNAYGELGVAAYTFELGGSGFFTSCTTFENQIFPDNLKALIYAAKVADTPYITASGPDIENIALSANDVAAGTMITVNGVATDTHFNNSNGTEAIQNIMQVEMFVDELPWVLGSTPTLMTATDGSYNSNNEAFFGQVNTTGMNSGQHVLYIQTTDASGITGVVYSSFFNIVNAADLGSLSGIVQDAITLVAIDASSLTFNGLQTQSNVSGQYSFTTLAGNYELNVNKSGYASASVSNITINAQQNTIQNILLQPVCALLDENVEAYNSIVDAESNGWSHAAVQGADDWSIDLTAGNIAPHAFKTSDVGVTTDKWLISPSVALTASSSLEFWHKYNFEGSGPFYDGAILEISTNAGISWQTLSSEITSGVYNVTLDSGNPLPNQAAWGGVQSDFGKVVVDLSSFAGNSAQLRWRFLADQSVGAGDWIIDDIQVLDPSACGQSDVLFINGFE